MSDSEISSDYSRCCLVIMGCQLTNLASLQFYAGSQSTVMNIRMVAVSA